MTDLLRVICDDCRTSFVSAHQHRRDELTDGEVTSLDETCPHCGERARYRRDDYRTGSLVGPCTPVTRPGDR